MIRFLRPGLATLAGAALLGFTMLHPRLERAHPEVDSTVVHAPDTLRLVFNEPVDPALATLSVDVGSVTRTLAPVAGTVPEEIVAAVLPLPAGAWSVRWQVAGPDGHPVTGTYAFTVEVAVTPPSPPAPPPAVVQDDEEPTLTVGSPAFVAARWITFAAVMTIIGAVAFHYLVLIPATPRLPGDGAALEATNRLAARIGRGGALFLILAAPVRLLLQLETLGGIGSGFLVPLLFETSYGAAWFEHLAGAGLAFGGFVAAARGRRGGWVVAAVAGVLAAFGLSMSSHAAASDLAALAITADAFHILAVSGWLGTLLVLAAAIPVAVGEDPRTGRFSTVATFVTTFSPRALAMAGIATVTGVFGAWQHLPTVSALWETDYGRALAVKVLLVLAAAAIGAFNWQRVRPRLRDGAPADQLRKTSAAELAVAALVLLVTAVLVALPTP